MKLSKLAKTSLLLMGITLVLVSCEPKPDTGDGPVGNGRLNKVERAILDDIQKLSKEIDWTNAQQKFTTINADIEKYVKKSRVRQDFHIAAVDAYCHSMDTIMQLLMGSESCGDGSGNNRHKQLKEIWALRTSDDYSSVTSPLHKAVVKTHEKHEEMLTFIKNATPSQKNITTWNTPYDEATERTKKSAAETHLSYLRSNNDIKCKYIKTSLDNIKNGSAFKTRRKNYCEAILELYLQGDSWSRKNEKILQGLLNVAFINLYPNDPNVSIWNEKINAFKEAHDTITHITV